MPCFDQASRLCDIVDDEGGLSVTVVHGCQRGETFLAGSIPDLELDGPVREVAFLREKGSCAIETCQWADDSVRDDIGARLPYTTRILGGGSREDGYVPPMVGSLFSWKSLLTKRSTRED